MARNDIKIAYLLLAHKEPEQVNLFVRQLLEYGDCDIYIHVDSKNKTMSKDIITNDHVFVYSEYDVRWGSFEICKATLLLMQKAQQSGKSYSHFYYGSGQDLLVKKGLYEFLANNRNKIFMRVNREIKKGDRASARYLVKWKKNLMVRGDRHIYRYVRGFIQLLCSKGIVLHRNKKRLSQQIKFFEGDTWFIAPFNILEYILQYLQENRDYYEYWENSLASDIMFFHTILMNSEYQASIEDELMYVHFGDTFFSKNHPMVITIDDNDKIDSGRYFCARKFDFADKETIDFYIEKTT